MSDYKALYLRLKEAEDFQKSGGWPWFWSEKKIRIKQFLPKEEMEITENTPMNIFIALTEIVPEENLEAQNHIDTIIKQHDINRKTDYEGKTMLHWACESLNFGIIKFLLKKENIEVNLKDDDGNTPLGSLINGYYNLYSVDSDVSNDDSDLTDQDSKDTIDNILDCIDFLKNKDKSILDEKHLDKLKKLDKRNLFFS